MNDYKKIIGIDYGSKLAGTTVIAYFGNNEIRIRQSGKKKDADNFILSFVKDKNPEYIFMDAPLSLPSVYLGKEGFDNYFYRECDSELRAMSPMFLGGLTARAMKLNASLGGKCKEVYPSKLIDELEIDKTIYKKEKINIPQILDLIMLQFPEEITLNKNEFENWHQVDAVLALLSGFRYLKGEALLIGNINEGQIII